MPMRPKFAGALLATALVLFAFACGYPRYWCLLGGATGGALGAVLLGNRKQKVLGTILGVAFALLAFSVYRAEQWREARDAALSQMTAFDLALEAFERDCGRCPTSAEGLTALIRKPDGLATNAWKGPYLKGPREIPRDPWGHAYGYACPGIHNPDGYDLSSQGPDAASQANGQGWANLNNWF